MATERWWSAGDGKGWPIRVVQEALIRAGLAGEGSRGSYQWPWSNHWPLCINRAAKLDPVVITANPLTWDLATLAGGEAMFLPNLCGPPREPREGEADVFSDLRYPL